MNIYNSIFSSDTQIAEQVARQIFEILSEDGPLVVIMDAAGNCLPSNSEKFESLNLSPAWLETFRSKIDDGIEPLISHIQDRSIVGAQLGADGNRCGYILMAIDESRPELALARIDLVEILLNQFNTIAKLIEKCNLLYQNQLKLYSPAYSN